MYYLLYMDILNKIFLLKYKTSNHKNIIFQRNMSHRNGRAQSVNLLS